MKQQTSAVFDSSVLLDASTPARQKRSGLYVRVLKRVFDICGALILLVLLSPVMLLLYILVRLDGGDGFFGHTRVGRNGALFQCWKLRTMVPDADEALRQHLNADPEAMAQWKRDRKLAIDPRITRLGHFLRRSSLDELPQLLNVMTGEMSLVGPRPVTLEELDNYGAYSWAYLSAVPGMTGLWQVSGRNKVTYQRRVALDVAYVRNTTFVWDLAILLKTVRVVLGGTGR